MQTAAEENNILLSSSDGPSNLPNQAYGSGSVDYYEYSQTPVQSDCYITYHGSDSAADSDNCGTRSGTDD